MERAMHTCTSECDPARMEHVVRPDERLPDIPESAYPPDAVPLPTED